MQAAGLPLAQAISIIGEQSDNSKLRTVLFSIRDDIQHGGNFSEALVKHPSVFSPLYVNMCKAGEIGGNLDVILERLSMHLEKQDAFRISIRKEIVVPCVIALLTAVAGVALMLGAMGSLAAVPPLPGKAPSNGALVAAYEYFAGLVKAAGIILAIILALVILAGAIRGKFSFSDGILLRLPFIGSVWKRLLVARFARILGTLQMSGVPILDGMDIIARTVGSKLFANAIFKVRASLREGVGISGPLKNAGIFPRMVIQMVSAGEETGKLDEMLLRIADFYDSEVETAILPAQWPMWFLMVGVALLVQGLVLRLVVSPIFAVLLSK